MKITIKKKKAKLRLLRLLRKRTAKKLTRKKKRDDLFTLKLAKKLYDKKKKEALLKRKSNLKSRPVTEPLVIKKSRSS